MKRASWISPDNPAGAFLPRASQGLSEGPCLPTPLPKPVQPSGRSTKSEIIWPRRNRQEKQADRCHFGQGWRKACWARQEERADVPSLRSSLYVGQWSLPPETLGLGHTKPPWTGPHVGVAETLWRDNSLCPMGKVDCAGCPCSSPPASSSPLSWPWSKLRKSLSPGRWVSPPCLFPHGWLPQHLPAHGSQATCLPLMPRPTHAVSLLVSFTPGGHGWATGAAGASRRPVGKQPGGG